MVILALETVTRRGSLALLDARGLSATSGESERTHGERLPLEITDWLAARGCMARDVDLFAVVSGPGSFTGLRVGMATVQGLAFAAHRPVVGIPTLEALASGWRAYDQSTPLVVTCLDGQRGDVFFAAWRPDRTAVLDAATAVVAPSVGTPEEAAEAIRRVREAESVIVVGTGGVRYPEPFLGLGGVRVAESPVPLASAAVMLAAERVSLAGPPHALRPIYLRRPDAVLARERQTS